MIKSDMKPLEHYAVVDVRDDDFLVCQHRDLDSVLRDVC